MTSRQAGFTLLELVIVLMIAAAVYLVLLSGPLGKVGAADLKAAARTLASGLRQTQTAAMATRHDAVLTLDVESKEFVTYILSGVKRMSDLIDDLLAYASLDAGETRGKPVDLNLVLQEAEQPAT